jgi:excisionase family DNA binding protein
MKPHTISEQRRIELLAQTYSLGELCLLLGVSQVTIRKWVREQVMPQERDGSYVLSKCLRVWVQIQMGTYEYLNYFPPRLRRNNQCGKL